MHKDDNHFNFLTQTFTYSLGRIVVLSSEIYSQLRVVNRLPIQNIISTNNVATVFASIGLNTYKEKTKMIKYNTQNTNSITVDGETLELLEAFTYMNSIIDQHEGSNADVKVRNDKARTTFI